MESFDLRVNYVTCPGWTEDITQIRRFDDLPEVARNFVQTFERMINLNRRRPAIIDRLGVGPGLDDVIIRS
jgi:adenylosuccinate synthase